jgi:hypothetical protein
MKGPGGWVSGKLNLCPRRAFDAGMHFQFRQE